MKKKHLLLLPALATLMMSCDENSLMDENSTKESSLSSSSVVSQNYLGKYGEGAMYEGIPIVGYWNVIDAENKVRSKLEFNRDGVYSSDIEYSHYGIDENGTLREGIYSGGDSKEHVLRYKIIEKLNNSCIRYNYESDSLTVTNQTFQLCKTDANITKLTEGVNVGRSATLNGYYGKGIRFGNHLLEGKWREYYENNTTSKIVITEGRYNYFDDNSTLERPAASLFDDYSPYVTYGVSGSGDEIIWGNGPANSKSYITLLNEYNSTCYRIHVKQYSPETYEDESNGYGGNIFCKLQ